MGLVTVNLTKVQFRPSGVVLPYRQDGPKTYTVDISAAWTIEDWHNSGLDTVVHYNLFRRADVLKIKSLL